MNFKEIVRDVLLTEIKELEKTANKIPFDIEKAIDLIVGSKGKLIVTGAGKSGLVGAKIVATFASTGTSSFFLHPAGIMHGDLGMIGKDDIVLGISYNGKSKELIQILPHLKRLNIPLIAMAESENSTLAKYADAFINIAADKEACPLDTAPASSTTLTTAMRDALTVCLMEKRDFKKEDFASFYPDGGLGKKLFVKVDDLLKKDNLPIISRGAKLKNAIIVISEGRLENVIIADENRTVSGVLSDGDLRRTLMNENSSINCNAEDIATLNPKTLKNEDSFTSDTLQIIENYKTQLLVVTDENNKLIGLLHTHDLIEAGIK